MWSFNDVINEFTLNINKTIDRVVKNFFLVQHRCGLKFETINLIKKMRVTYEIEKDIRY